MEISARPCITAGVAVVAAGMVAVTPVTPSLPDVQLPDIQLSGFTDSLQTMELGFNSGLVDGFTGFNGSLVDGQIGLEQIFGGDSILNGVVNRSFNAFNMMLGAGQNSFLGLLGADFNSGDITSSLIVGLNSGVFNGGDIGGLEGILGQSLKVVDNIIGFPGTDLLTGLEADMTSFNSQIVDGFTAFNGSLVGGEIGLEQIFGGDSILNGVVNRSFNAFNMMLGAGQQSFLGLLGADFNSQDITSSLLVGLNPDLVFNSGEIGGLMGAFDQGLIALIDAFGGIVP